MTFKELKEKLNQASEEQLSKTAHMLYSADEVVTVELAATHKGELLFIPEYEFE